MKKIFLLITIALLANITQVFAQSGRVITGTISDESGLGLPGANVVERGTTNGTITNTDGKFTIKLSTAVNQLDITFIGYTSIRIKVGSAPNYDVIMKPDVTALEEMVVVGYGTQKKASLVGAISQVTSDELQQSSTPSLTNSLAGRVAGVITVMGSGKPGSDNSKIYVRGMATTNNTDSLYW